ncbi:MAG: hypothetical protein F6K56_17410 [Moorea sp. SIO3G5]|nr:hypothetical protein [Moorena sp. SIO3G5]
MIILLTLPDLKARGFLDQRAALNRRIPIFDSAKNRTVLKPKTRQDQVLSQFTTDPEGDSPLAFGYLIGSALRSPFPSDPIYKSSYSRMLCCQIADLNKKASVIC